MNLSPSPKQQFFDNNGRPAVGFQLFTYVAGTSTKLETFQDQAGTPNTNPIILDYRGEANIWIDPELTYKYVLADRNDTDPPGNPVWSVDDISTFLTNADITQQFLGRKLWPRSQAEIDAGVTPIYYFYFYGDIRRYGAVGDGIVDCQNAIEDAIAQAIEDGGAQVLIPDGGVYAHSDTIIWGFGGLRVLATGGARLLHTGSGVANQIGDGSDWVYNVSLLDLHEVGNSSTTYCFDIRQVKNSVIRLRGHNATTAAFRLRFCISNEFYLINSQNEEPFTTTPVNSMILDNDGTPGDFSGFNLFTNMEAEGVSGYGIVLGEAVGNVFATGASQGNGGGVNFSSDDAAHNTFQNFNAEQNDTYADFTIQGRGNQFINCNSLSSAVTDSTAVSNADATLFVGGFMRSVALDVTSTNASFFGMRTSDNGALGIHGSGTYTCVGVIECDTNQVATAKFPDLVGESGTFTPIIYGGSTAGSQTYAANGQVGVYTRIGKTIAFTIYLELTANSGGTGNALIGGLPVASRNTTNAYQVFVVGEFSGVTLTGAGRQLALQVAPNNTVGTLVDSDSGASPTPITIGNIGATAIIMLCGTLQI